MERGRRIGPKHVAAASGKDNAMDNFVFHFLLAICGFFEIFLVLNSWLAKPNIQVHGEKPE
jgi:hypothetical protein